MALDTLPLRKIGLMKVFSDFKLARSREEAKFAKNGNRIGWFTNRNILFFMRESRRFKTKAEKHRKKMEHVRAIDDQTLPSVLQFFASSDDEKARFLPKNTSGHSYVFNECGDKTDSPLFYFTCAAQSLIERYLKGRPDKTNLLPEILALLEFATMFSEYGFFVGWSMDRAHNEGGIFCENTAQLWCTIRRLSILALMDKGWPLGFPSIGMSLIHWDGTRLDKK